MWARVALEGAALPEESTQCNAFCKVTVADMWMVRDCAGCTSSSWVTACCSLCFLPLEWVCQSPTLFLSKSKFLGPHVSLATIYLVKFTI